MRVNFTAEPPAETPQMLLSGLLAGCRWGMLLTDANSRGAVCQTRVVRLRGTVDAARCSLDCQFERLNNLRSTNAFVAS
jgi:hypothetical protein